MGKHSSGSQWRYYRSVAGWLLPWFVVACLVVGGIWVGVSALGGGGDDEPKASGRTSPAPSHTPKESDRPSPEPSGGGNDDGGDPESSPPALITEGISVQVLNGTASIDADEAMANRLAELGFEVVAVADSSQAYERTTVFWSYPDAERAAKALAARFDWVAQPRPENLSTTVSMHVIVGADFL